MVFMDWNSNGKIDPDDIAINIAFDDNDEEVGYSVEKKKPNTGCLVSALRLFGVIVIISLLC